MAGKRKTIPDVAEAAFRSVKEGDQVDKERPVLRGGRSRITVDISSELAESARAAVFWTPGETLQSLVERAVAREIEKMEEERGESFPARVGGELKRGRPMK